MDSEKMCRYCPHREIELWKVGATSDGLWIHSDTGESECDTEGGTVATPIDSD